MFIGSIGQKNTNRHKRPSTLKIILVLGLLSLAYLLASYFVRPSASSRGTSPAAVSDAPSDLLGLLWSDPHFSIAPKSSETHAVYAYSVIPGGVKNAKELREALRRDPVVAAHYANFNVSSSRLIHLTSARKVHVSYRIGNEVFWTRKQLTLRPEETLLTDGTHFARTRCGNRVAEVPDGPPSPAEPPIETLDKPVFPRPLEFPTDSPPEAPIWAENSAPILLPLTGPAVPVVPGAGGPPFLPIGPIIPCCAGPGKPSTPSQPTPPPPPLPPGPPVATPEPSSFVQLVVGVAGVLLFLRFRSR